MRSDIHIDTHTRRVHMVDGGCFLHKSNNGILHEMHAAEGFWLFQGPPDNASYNCFGTIFNHHKDVSSFPTSTLRYHDKFPARGTIVSCQHAAESTQFFGVECACEACRSLSFSLESFITPILTSRAQAWATLKIPSALRDLESMIPQLTMFPEKTKGFRVAVATRYVYL
jgi:hypothetical protein